MDNQIIEHGDLLQLTSEIVSAHVSNNPVPLNELAGLIQTVHATLGSLNGPVIEPEVELKPAVNPKNSESEAISVVYIEDDARLARLTARYLESHGTRVTIAPCRSSPSISSRFGLPYSCTATRKPATGSFASSAASSSCQVFGSGA